MTRRRDVLLAAAFLAGAVAEILAGDLSPPGLYGAVALGTCVPLVWRRRWPLGVVIVQSAAFAALGAEQAQPANFQVLALIVGIYTLGDRVPGTRGIAGLAMPVAAVIVQTLVVDQLDDAIWIAAVILVPPWLAGRAVRARRAQLAALEAVTAELRAEHDRAAALAAEAERVRLAREMHDVLSQGTSIVLLQAAAGERLLRDDPAAAAQAFRSIRGAAAEALAELEAAVGDLPPELDLQPIVDRVRAGGLDVAVNEGVDLSTLQPGVALTALRIVQEGLTNALKHGGRSATVDVGRRDGSLAIRIHSAGVEQREQTGGGRGLVGMRERAAAYGGHVEAGPLGDGRFEVRALLPVGSGS